MDGIKTIFFDLLYWTLIPRAKPCVLLTNLPKNEIVWKYSTFTLGIFLTGSGLLDFVHEIGGFRGHNLLFAVALWYCHQVELSALGFVEGVGQSEVPNGACTALSHCRTKFVPRCQAYVRGCRLGEHRGEDAS